LLHQGTILIIRKHLVFATLNTLTLFKLLAGIALIVLLSACSTKEPEILTEEEYYQKAKAALDNRSFQAASEHLEDLETYHPFGRYAEHAQLDLLFARYQSLDPIGAAAAADRFIRLHPDSPNVDYAHYIKGLAAYYADESLTLRYFPININSRDPGQAREAFREFSLLVSQYPESPYAADAERRMIAIKNRLAAYELHVARYYVQRQAFVAAVGRTRYIIENYPQTTSVADALALSVELYRLLGLDEYANDAIAVLATSFPEHQSFDQNMRFNGNQIELKNRGISQIFSFDGFISEDDG